MSIACQRSCSSFYIMTSSFLSIGYVFAHMLWNAVSWLWLQERAWIDARFGAYFLPISTSFPSSSWRLESINAAATFTGAVYPKEVLRAFRVVAHTDHSNYGWLCIETNASPSTPLAPRFNTPIKVFDGGHCSFIFVVEIGDLDSR